MMMMMLEDLLSNFVLIAVAVSWFTAQSLKVVIYRFQEDHWDFWHFFEAGGMPSAHSATVTSLTLAVAMTVGLQSPLFVACLVLAAIVMYDATGVRRAAGKQAELLNKIIDDSYSTGKVKIDKLREILGHDPLEVLAGASLAVVLTHIAYYVYFIR